MLLSFEVVQLYYNPDFVPIVFTIISGILHSLWEKMRTGKMVNMTTLGLQNKSINPDKSYKYPFLSRQSIKYLDQSGSCQTEERQWRQHRTFSSVIVLRIFRQDQWAPHSTIHHTNKWQNFLLFLALDINIC